MCDLVASDPLGEVPGSPDPEPADPLVLVRLAARTAWPWLAGAGVVLAVLGGVFGAQATWGDVATWVLAVTGLLTLVAAVFAGLVAYAVLAVEIRRDQFAAAERRRAEQEWAQKREADRMAQASKVAAWYGTWEVPITYVGLSPGPPAAPLSGALIRNASDLPVYDVRVLFCVPVDPWQDWHEGERHSEPLTNPLAPGSATVALPDHIRQQEEASTGQRTLAWQVVIEFTDAGGERWRRDTRGKLESPPGIVLQKDGG